MAKVVGVFFRSDKRIYNYTTEDLELKVGDGVILENDRGAALAYVAYPPADMDIEGLDLKLRAVIRQATEEDAKVEDENRGKEQEAFKICLQKIHAREMPMKLINVEFLFDRSKIIFYFVADGRVDFRDLVKDLAHEFQTRIEMRQIGVRDEAKYFGGLGTCGREFCCATVLRNFDPVSVRMAKEQNLALNPMKISGACGRLMCCLGYEYDMYMNLKKDLPACGKKIVTEYGEGKVIRQDVIKRRLVVKLEDGREVEVESEKVTVAANNHSAPEPPADDRESRSKE